MSVPVFEGGRVFDVVVVGNGGLGLSLGLVLARRGATVAVMGRPHRPGGASPAAGAMLGVFGEVTAASSRSEFGRTTLEWGRRAARLWPEWLAGLAETGPGSAAAASDGADLLTADGTVVVLNTVGLPEIDTQNFTAIREALVEHGEEFEDVDPEDVEWLDPEPTARPLRAMFLPGEHAVDASGLLARLEIAFTAAGGVLIAEQARRVEHAGERVRGVELESGAVVGAGQVVLAAGAGSQALLETVPEQAERIPRLVSGCGVSAVVDSDDGTSPRSVLRTPNRDLTGGLHMVPRGGGQVYVGATNRISARPRQTAPVSDVLSLLDSGSRQLRRGLGESGLRRFQVGNRPVAADGMPLLGETGLTGLWMMTGTHRDGLTLSPLLAREMAAAMLGDRPDIELEMFAPVRSVIEPMSRAEVAQAAVTHVLAMGYQANWKMPVEWPSMLEATLAMEFYRDPPEVPTQVGALLRSGPS